MIVYEIPIIAILFVYPSLAWINTGTKSQMFDRKLTVAGIEDLFNNHKQKQNFLPV